MGILQQTRFVALLTMMNIEKKLAFDDVRTLLKGRCISSLGTEWVDKFVTFSSDYNKVTHNLNLASEFQRFVETEDDIYEENFFDVRQALLRMRPERTHLEEVDLFDLKRSLITVHALVEFFTKGNDDAKEGEEVVHTYPTLAALASDVQSFPHIIQRIDNVLNKYGKVKDTASKELLMIRHSIEVNTRTLSHSLRGIIQQAQQEGYIERDVSPTLRDGRLVIPVSPAVKRKIRGIVHDESATGKTVFIEPATVVEANNKIRELKAQERREIIRILQELSAEIRPHINAILHSQHFLAQIDYLRAVVSFAESFGCIVPRIQEEPTIDLSQAYHPLLQQSLQRHGKKMQPLDITLRNGRILLISGPNAGGKSVCLKTVGLLQYMVQCGLPIPVRENSTLGIFSEIFIDIGDEQSIENDLSTYSSHLLNMKLMMKGASSKSLLLIDEFGGGTEPQIGGALAEGILHRFVKTGTWGIITTHYQNLKHYAEQEPAVINGAMLYDRAQMQPLFILQVGNPGSSFAVEIARKIGIPEDVIAYASELVGKDYIMSDKYLQDIVRDKMYWEKKRQTIRSREKQLEETVARYEEEMQQFQQQRKSVMAQAKEEAQQLLKDTNAKIENTIREIRETQAEKERTREIRQELSEFREALAQTSDEESIIARKIEKIKRRQERKQAKQEQAKAGNATATTTSSIATEAQNVPTETSTRLHLEAGQYVRIKGQTAVGKVESVQGKNAKILFGSMYTSLPINRLELADKPKEDNAMKAATFVSKETRDAMQEKQLNFKQDIDLRGMRVDEALTAVAYFIDDAIQVGQARVRILHGTGTGALRQVVRQYLSTATGVMRYHDEHVQFGGAGITVVELI